MGLSVNVITRLLNLANKILAEHGEELVRILRDAVTALPAPVNPPVTPVTPTPGPVVPIFFDPFRTSRWPSSSRCHGNTTCAVSESFRFAGVTFTPSFSSPSSSDTSPIGSTTTPLPITQIFFA